MKHFKKIAVFAAVLVVVTMVLASCGNSFKDDPAVGTWEMTKAEYSGQTVTVDEFKSSKAITKIPTLEIKEDGPCQVSMFGVEGEGTVSAGEDGTYDMQDDSDQIVTFEIKDGELRLDLEEQSAVLIFEKK